MYLCREREVQVDEVFEGDSPICRIYIKLTKSRYDYEATQTIAIADSSAAVHRLR